MNISVTGIKPTGTPHIGNYFGAIKPALELASNYIPYYFIADYHALNSIHDKKRMKDMCYEVAAAWLACGLDPEQVVFYRQSHVPETIEIANILFNFTPKGLMNRAHAYKAMLQQNSELNRDPDFGVNMGLFTYPILMAADILQFNAHKVPVGKDQQQHIEMAADIAQAFNHAVQKEVLTIPQPLINQSTMLVPGLDGRKMSKSYNNTIPLFLPKGQLKKHIMRIVTNSQTVDEPKDPDTCSIFTLYKYFANQQEIETLRQRYLAGGMGWGDAKKELLAKIEDVVGPIRERYDQLMADKGYIDQKLIEGATKARIIARRTLNKMRKAVGFDEM